VVDTRVGSVHNAWAKCTSIMGIMHAGIIDVGIMAIFLGIIKIEF
jgi:hypothetical protein